MIDEYVSNPRLALLAEELRILNENLIAQKLPDSVRLSRLRQFATMSNRVTGYTMPELETVEDEVCGYRWQVMFRGKSIGPFETPTKAHEAFKAAHIGFFGTKSEYHPDFFLDTSHLYEGGTLPRGITIGDYGKFRVRFMRNLVLQSAQFDTMQEAITALEEARA